MKKLIMGIIFVACIFAIVGWGSTYDERGDKAGKRFNDRDRNHEDRDNGFKNAEKKHQADDETIKQSQGDASGARDIHDNKNHQYE